MQKFKIFKSQLWLERDLEEIWSFHKDPHNLIKISPDFLSSVKLSMSVALSIERYSLFNFLIVFLVVKTTLRL
jgi:ligand-binding SRPBCC domain-containing protein